MAARFSDKQLDVAHDLAEKADVLRGEVLPLAQADADAYAGLIAAYRLPKDDPARDEAIAAAAQEAARIPLEIAAYGAEIALLAARLAEEGNPNLNGDAAAAALLAAAATRTCANLVRINLDEDADEYAKAVPARRSRRGRRRARARNRAMSATVIDGEALAAELRQEVEREFEALAARGVKPGLATVLVGDDYAAKAYERRVRRLAEELGCHYTSETLAPDVEHADALAVVGKLNADPRVSGILVLRPLPPQVSEAGLYRTLDPLKDVEAVHPDNAGLLALGEPRFTPSTPAAIFFLLDRYVERSGRDPATFYNGLDLVLVGRSNNVGKPALWLGLARGATVVSCHHFTSQAGRLAEHTLRADIVIVAAGVPAS